MKRITFLADKITPSSPLQTSPSVSEITDPKNQHFSSGVPCKSDAEAGQPEDSMAGKGSDWGQQSDPYAAAKLRQAGALASAKFASLTRTFIAHCETFRQPI